MHIVWAAMGQGDDPRDQQAHLFGPFWAVVGPEGDSAHGEWVWAIYEVGAADDPVAEGFAYHELDAKDAVLQWARPRAPRTFGRRIRSFRRRMA